MDNSLQLRRSKDRRPALVSRWLSLLVILFAQVSKADRFEETSGDFYVGVGDQFDDDRRRIHQAE
jgi:hypothetical protein